MNQKQDEVNHVSWMLQKAILDNLGYGNRESLLLIPDKRFQYFDSYHDGRFHDSVDDISIEFYSNEFDSLGKTWPNFVIEVGPTLSTRARIYGHAARGGSESVLDRDGRIEEHLAASIQQHIQDAFVWTRQVWLNPSSAIEEDPVPEAVELFKLGIVNSVDIGHSITMSPVQLNEVNLGPGLSYAVTYLDLNGNPATHVVYLYAIAPINKETSIFEAFRIQSEYIEHAIKERNRLGMAHFKKV
ncbi:MAG: hypothetical protein CL678_15640 [Bdellovibrionaceae bacterium]|nr:hypothetical protein [Pseudobdellovibrionaceae bacterium]|tara:strand:+ start:127 stop:855 length:729 start_codon:yes stop_codon:yes gene_type:complete